tara:strand:+ start:345 stop:797 length:453 start_codon:yes stop_codon:yes gene_type:complete
MKFNGSYDCDRDIIKFPVTLITPHKRIKTNIIIDTGSPHTLLNYGDSLVLGIPHTTKSELIKIGGRAYQSYIFNNFKISFKSEKEEVITEELPIRVMKPTSLKVNELEELDNFPNILGLDFLKLGYKFVCNLEDNEIYLEKLKDAKNIQV